MTDYHASNQSVDIVQRLRGGSTQATWSFPGYLAEAADEIERLRAEVVRLTDVLRRNGFRECDIPACNCGSWHHVGGFAERFREIDEATADDERNGETLLTRIGRIVADRERLRAALTDIAEPKGMDNESENALRRHIARRALEGAASVAPAERKP